VRCKSPQQADKILAAAARLFASHRFHEARMEDIAALAEVGKGTLYRYFHDKEELYMALLARAAEEYSACLHDAVSEAPSPRDKLVALAFACLSYFHENPHVLDLIQHAEVMQKPGQEFPWQKARNRATALAQELFQAGNHAGVFAVDDPGLAALMFLGGLRAVLRFGNLPDPAGQAGRIVAGFLGGYGAPPTPAPPGPLKRPPRAALAVQVIDGASSSLHNA
jgi:AcrR family transcriptional regulator